MKNLRKFLSFFSVLLSLFVSSNLLGQNVLDFDGNDDYIVVNNLNPISTGISGQYTVELWVRLQGYPTYWAWLFGDEANENGGIQIAISSQGYISTFKPSAGGIVSTQRVSLNTWTHIAFAQDDNHLKLYVNGIFQQNLLSGSDRHQETSDPTYLGMFPLGGRNLNGRLENVRVWNVARTASQIADNKDCEIANNTPGLVAHYTFNQGVANGNNAGVTTLIDGTSNGNNGTLTNFALNGSSSNWVSGFNNPACTPATPASIAITSSSQSVCSGESVTFTATAANTSATPVYQWKKNGTVVGSNSATYTASNLANGDVITCALTSEAGSPASNSITMNNTLSVSISNTGASACLNTANLSVSGATGASSIEWKKDATVVNTATGGTPATSGVTVAGGNGYGANPNQFSYIGGISIDAAGNLYVVDYNNSRVQKWAPGATSGVTVAGGNGQGSAANQLDNPAGIAIDAAGNIYISDYNNNRIQKWAPGATSGVTVAGGNGGGLAANQVYGPRGIWIDAVGTIYISEYVAHRVTKWLPNATSGIVVAGGNNWGMEANQLRGPGFIYVDAAGNLYIADNNNNRVQKWAPGATSGVTVAGGNGPGGAANQFHSPGGVWVDASGNVYVADGVYDRIQKWAPGATSGVTIAGGNGRGTAANQLYGPGSIFINGGDLYIADLGRVQKWNLGILSTSYMPTSVGSYTATVSLNGCTGTTNAIDVITTPSVPSISGASAVDIAASITLTNTTAGGTWTSSNPTVATVVNGVVTGVSPGDATITYTVTNACGSNAATKTIRVNDNSTYCLKYVPRRVGNTVEFTISMIGSGSTLRLGTANIQIKYNTNALSTPTLVSEVLTATGNYSGVTLTQPSPLNLGANEAIISLNTNFTGTTGQGLAISTDEGGTPIAVVSFQLQNASASPNLQSYLNNDIGSVIYNDNTSNPYLVQNTGGCANYTAPLTTSLSYDAASFCLSATPQNPTMTGATGGTYSSTAGLTIDGSTGVITPATSTPATYWVTYTVPNPQGGTTAFQVTIHPNPTVNITNLNASYCQNASAVALSGTPSGGAFTINGTNATSLNPSALALGSHSVVYTYTDANTCTGTATQNITINGLPIISAITGASSVYIGSTITLSNATVGGVWSSANSSFATISNEGVVTGVAEGNAVINYAVTNACGTTTVNHNLAVQLSKILLTAKAILQGNYNAATSLMSDNLRQNNLIPTTEPYTTTNNFTHRGGGGGEVTNSTVLQTTGNDAIVDWIFVELRDKNAPATVLYTRAALVQRDGDIVDVDGTSAVSFSNAMPDDYYVAIRHRNHLGFRTAATVAIGRTVGNTLDLTDGTVTLFGRNALKAMSNGKFAMYGGNGDSNGAINAIDKNTIWIIQNGLNTYLRGDFNLDGVVNAFDINSIWLPNNSVVQQLD